jgi:hypothetical protein
VTCSMSASSRCSDTTHTASAAAGQTFSIKITGSSVPGVPIEFRVRVH